MNAVVKKQSQSLATQLPKSIQKLLAAGGGFEKDLSGGVAAGFPVISYRGKVWRIRKGGEEDNVVNEEGEAVPSIELVIVRAHNQPSKIFYEKGYEEGSTESPRCWSVSGLKPDPSVEKPISPTCMGCPKNVWGSKITEQQKKAKACADSRRMAVVSLEELMRKAAGEMVDELPVYLLRAPAASLMPLKDYAEKVLQPKGLPYFAVVTKVGFEPDASYPQLTFRAKRLLSDEEAEVVVGLRDSEDVRRILAESGEFAAAGTPTDVEASDSSEEESTAPAAAAAPKKKAKAAPVEEEVGIEEDEPAPAPVAKKKAKPAPAVVEEEEEEEEIAPPPKKKAAKPAPVTIEDDDEEEEEVAPAPVAKKKKAAAKPAPVTIEEDEDEEDPAPAPAPASKKKAAAKPAAVPAADSDDFDAMLSDILK